MHHFILILFSLTTLSACVSGPRFEDLSKPTEARCIDLPNGISYKISRGIGGIAEWEDGLVPARYKLVAESSEGHYFEAPGKPFWQTRTDIKTKYFIARGGIFIPKTSAKTPRIYIYTQAQPETTDSIDNYIAANYTNNPASPGYNTSSGVVGTAVGGALVNAFIAMESNRLVTIDHKGNSEFIAAVSKEIPCE